MCIYVYMYIRIYLYICSYAQLAVVLETAFTAAQDSRAGTGIRVRESVCVAPSDKVSVAVFFASCSAATGVETPLHKRFQHLIKGYSSNVPPQFSLLFWDKACIILYF